MKFFRHAPQGRSVRAPHSFREATEIYLAGFVDVHKDARPELP